MGQGQRNIEGATSALKNVGQLTGIKERFSGLSRSVPLTEHFKHKIVARLLHNCSLEELEELEKQVKSKNKTYLEF